MLETLLKVLTMEEFILEIRDKKRSTKREANREAKREKKSRKKITEKWAKIYNANQNFVHSITIYQCYINGEEPIQHWIKWYYVECDFSGENPYFQCIQCENND